MKKLLLSLFCVLAVAASAFADTWTYTPTASTEWTGVNTATGTVTKDLEFTGTITGSDQTKIKWVASDFKFTKNKTTSSWYLGFANGGVQLGSANALLNTLKLTTDYFKGKKINSIEITARTKSATVGKFSYDVIIGSDKKTSGIISGSTFTGYSISPINTVVQDNLIISLQSTDTSFSPLYIQKIAITYSDAGPVEPQWDFPSGTASIFYGESYTPSVLNLEDGLKDKITYKVVNADDGSDVVTPNADGSYTPNAGNYNVIATTPATDEYKTRERTYSLHVDKATPAISWSASAAEAVVGQDFNDPTLSGVPAGLSVIYDSSNKDVATIDDNGVVSIVAAGTTTISAQAVGEGNYNDSNEATYTLTVQAAGFVPSPSFSVTDETVKVGTVVNITSSLADATVKYSGTFTGYQAGAAEEPIDETAASSITLDKAGMWELKAIATLNGKDSQPTEQTYMVEKYSPTLAFANPADVTTDTETSPAQNIASASGDLCESHAPVITYESSDPTVATVNEYGTVTVLGKVGETTITATLVADAYYEEKTVSYLVTVQEPVYVATFDFTTDSYGIPSGNTNSLPATFYNSDKTSEPKEPKLISLTFTDEDKNKGLQTYGYYSSSNDLRFYNGIEMTIASTSNDKVITSVTITTTQQNYKDPDGNVVSNSSCIYKPKNPVQSLKFVGTGTSKISKIEVTYKKLKDSNLAGFEAAQSVEFNHDGIVIPGKFAAEGVKVNASIAPAEGAEFINPENNSDYKNFDKEAMMADLMAKDSYLYDGTEEKAGYLEASLGDANENLTVTVPCSGKYVVTLTLVDPDGDYIPVEPVTCPVEVYPSYAGLHINYNPVNEDGNCYVDPAKAGKARLGVDAMFCTLQYRLSGASSEQSSERPAIRRAAAEDDGFLTYPHFLADGDGVDLSNGTQLEVRLSKNGTQSNAGGDVNGTAAKTIFISNNPEVGVEGIESELGAEPEYYTLQGVRVSGENLQPGIYVVRAGNKTYKVLVK